MTSVYRTLTGERLVDVMAESVRRFVERLEPHRLYVFVSGGKDSAAAAAAVAYAGDSILRRAVVVYNEIVGNSHPWNVEQAYRVARSLGFEEPVVVESLEGVAYAVYSGARSLHIRARDRRGRGFWGALLEWGVPVLTPGGRLRWCLHEFKVRWWLRLPAETGYRRYSIVGVKARDSRLRLSRWSGAVGSTRIVRWRLGSATITEYMHSPVLHMTDEQVWQALREAGIDRHMRTYELCGDSLNCTFCPLRDAKRQRRIVECVAQTPEGRAILAEAKTALERLTRTHTETVTGRKAREWLEAIHDTLGRGTQARSNRRSRQGGAGHTASTGHK